MTRTNKTKQDKMLELRPWDDANELRVNQEPPTTVGRR